MDFKEACELPIGKNVEKKGRFSYLSWAYAVKFLRENFPDATWEIHENEHNMPYFQSQAGSFVGVTVIHDNRKYTQWHPVLDNKNQTIQKPNAFQINTSIQRCLAKAIGIATGIGLGLYVGEDLPTEDEPQQPKTPTWTKDDKAQYNVLKEELDACQAPADVDEWLDEKRNEGLKVKDYVKTAIMLHADGVWKALKTGE